MEEDLLLYCLFRVIRGQSLFGIGGRLIPVEFLLLEMPRGQTAGFNKASVLIINTMFFICL